jgi:type IV secretion system protein VirB4
MLTPHTLLLGFNAIETKDAYGARRFGALLSLKQYRELPPETADRILQSPIELIISQNITFMPDAKALKQYKEQKALFDISGDSYSAQACGLDEMLTQNQNRPTDFCEQQTSIMVIVDEYKQLDPQMHKAQEAFTDIGLITIREDIKLEECYWSMLPGNFEFVRRQEPVSAARVGGFCRLNRFPNGNSSGLHWGDALTLIPTSVNSPYYFNFHHQDNGHTLLLDYNSFGDPAGLVTLNFLLTLSLKYKGHLYVFDRRHSAQLLFDKLESPYWRFAPDASARPKHLLRIHPFSLEDNKRNHAFLLAWCVALIEPVLDVSDEQKELLRGAITAMFALPVDERGIEQFAGLLAQSDAELAKALVEYHGGGKYAGLFNSRADDAALKHSLNAFDMNPIVADARLTIPVFSYLLHRIIQDIDGKPAIIVLHEAWDLLENSFFAPRLESLLEMLKQNNVMVIFTTRNPQNCEGTKTLQTLMQSCATRLYIPDDIVLDYASETLGLNGSDSRMLMQMQRNVGDVLLKQDNESIALRVNLNDAYDLKAVYANDIKNLVASGGKFASLPKD